MASGRAGGVPFRFDLIGSVWARMQSRHTLADQRLGVDAIRGGQIGQVERMQMRCMNGNCFMATWPLCVCSHTRALSLIFDVGHQLVITAETKVFPQNGYCLARVLPLTVTVVDIVHCGTDHW